MDFYVPACPSSSAFPYGTCAPAEQMTVELKYIAFLLDNSNRLWTRRTYRETLWKLTSGRLLYEWFCMRKCHSSHQIFPLKTNTASSLLLVMLKKKVTALNHKIKCVCLKFLHVTSAIIGLSEHFSVSHFSCYQGLVIITLVEKM